MKKQGDSSIKAQLLWSALILLSLLAACAIPFALAQSRSRGINSQAQFQKTAATSPRLTLTFSERVAYQRAIEEVYWRHRIWPAANAGPKPPLDKVMSHEAIEKKVEDYLRNSQALEDYWQRPITPDQLQAEMERIASHTKQPGVLRELFAALGNDPFVITECLARPALAERLLTNWYAYDQRIQGELKHRAEAELQAYTTVEQMKQLSGTYSEMEFIRDDSSQVKETREPRQVVKLNASEWEDSVQKLATIFGDAKYGRVRLLGAPLTQIKLGVLSSLQQDEEHYYTVAVLNKTNDRIKIATVAWPKEPFESRIRTTARSPLRREGWSSSTISPRLSLTS